MVKMWNKVLLKFYTKRVNTLSSKIKFNESYILVYEELLISKINAKVARFKNQNDHKLSSIKKLTYSKNEYIEIYAKEELSKIENKLYWKRRAINHKYNKLADKNASNEELRTQKLKNIEFKYKEKVEKIKLNYSKKHNEELTTIKLVEYELKKESFQNELSNYENKLIENKNIKYANHYLKANDNIKKAKIKLDYLRDKLNKYIDLVGQKHQIEDSENILEIKNLTMQFGGLKAVNDLNFNVKSGEIFGLIGPNGAGKTTVFNCLTQFYKPKEGNIYYRNTENNVVNLNSYKVHEVINQGIARTFQNVELIWELSVLDNMLLGAHSTYNTGFFQHLIQSRKFKREEATMRSKAINILKDLDLIDYIYAFPIGLPYGVLKKIELARTLMTNPNLIILDEPAAGLNEAETAELAKTIKKIQKDYACTIFLVEHDMGLVMDICDTICAISFGKLLAIGTPNEIQNNKAVKEAYLGGE